MIKNQKKILIILLPNFGHIFWIISFFFVLLIGRFMINADGDLALHLNLGKYILETGNVPLKDIFSHTRTGEIVTQHEWLSAVIFELIHRFFGLSGVVLLCALVIASTFYLLFRNIKTLSDSMIIAFLVALLAMISSMVHWVTRPHIFSFFLLTCWILSLDQIRKGKFKRWWIIPVLMLLWVNLHGGFIIGFITWLIYGLGIAWDAFLIRLPEKSRIKPTFWRYYLLGGIASFGVSLLNPSGIGLWIKVVTHLGNRYLADFTMEFGSPNFHNTITMPYLILIASLIIALGYNKQRIRSEMLFNSAAWLVMGLYSVRNIPLAAIVTAPLLAIGLKDILSQAAQKIKLLEKLNRLDNRFEQLEKELKGFLWPIICIIIVLTGLIMGYKFDIERKGYTFDPEFFPIEAVRWLKDHPQEGEMFNAYGWGGYLQYRLWPGKRVFIDSKADFYGEDFVRKYEQVMRLQTGWEKVLDQYNVDWAILPTDEDASKAFNEGLGWEIIYEDETAVILRRR